MMRTPEQRLTEPVTLWGMMSSGKSTVGKLLSVRFGVNFVDTDGLIVEATGKKPGDIINDPDGGGIEEFLEIQRAVIASHPRSEVDIWATGGAVIKDEQTLRHVTRYGKHIFLAVAPEIIEARITEDEAANLVNPRGLPVGQLYMEERMPEYTSIPGVISIPVEGSESPFVTAHRVEQKLTNLSVVAQN